MWLSKMVPRRSSAAPWRISETKWVLLGPSVTEAIGSSSGPSQLVDASRDLQKEWCGISPPASSLAVIRVAPVDAVVPLGRRPRECRTAPPVAAHTRGIAEDLLAVAGALEERDLRRHDCAVDYIAE